MARALVPATGWAVVHLFAKPRPGADAAAIVAAVERATGRAGEFEAPPDATGPAHRWDHQVVCAALLGHKADCCIMGIGPDMWRLRALQSDLQRAGLDVVDSYVSLTEVSEYAAGMPQDHLDVRLYPQLPPAGKDAFCFYPMSRTRDVGANWFATPFERRNAMMREHGTSGRAFAGRVVQVVTGSTGLDDFEWGVTLFAVRPDDLKDVVYTLRFDEASAVYGVFGRFYTGMVCSPEALVERLGLR